MGRGTKNPLNHHNQDSYRSDVFTLLRLYPENVG